MFSLRKITFSADNRPFIFVFRRFRLRDVIPHRTVVRVLRDARLEGSKRMLCFCSLRLRTTACVSPAREMAPTSTTLVFTPKALSFAAPRWAPLLLPIRLLFGSYSAPYSAPYSAAQGARAEVAFSDARVLKTVKRQCSFFKEQQSSIRFYWNHM